MVHRAVTTIGQNVDDFGFAGFHLPVGTAHGRPLLGSNRQALPYQSRFLRLWFGTTLVILGVLSGNYSSYCYLDIGTIYFARAWLVYTGCYRFYVGDVLAPIIENLGGNW